MCSGDSVDGRVTDRDSSLSLANVNIYTVGREWIASAVSGSDGRFTISGVCVAGLKLKARKGGYESVLLEYIVTSGSSVNVVMLKLGTSKENRGFSRRHLAMKRCCDAQTGKSVFLPVTFLYKLYKNHCLDYNYKPRLSESPQYRTRQEFI